MAPVSRRFFACPVEGCRNRTWIGQCAGIELLRPPLCTNPLHGELRMLEVERATWAELERIEQQREAAAFLAAVRRALVVTLLIFLLGCAALALLGALG